MIVQVMDLINSSLFACSQFFVRIFNASGMVEIYISIFFIVFGFKFLLSPVLGKSMGSDRAREKSDE